MIRINKALFTQQIEDATVCDGCQRTFIGNWRFTWCAHLFCAYCAGGVVKRCPVCGESAPTMKDGDYDYGVAIPAPDDAGDLSAFRPILGLVAVAVFMIAMAWWFS